MTAFLETIVTVKPKNVATFRAVRLTGPDDVASLREIAGGWDIEVFDNGEKGLWAHLTRRGRNKVVLREGHWLVALGNSGSIRAISDRQLHHDYQIEG